MRLTQSERTFLIKRVTETVFDNEAKTNFEAFMDSERTRLIAVFMTKYPKHVMETARPYFDVEDTYELRVRSSNRCRNHEIKIQKPIAIPQYRNSLTCDETYERIDTQTKNAKEAHEAIRKHYLSIIYGATTWKKLLEMWPEAEVFMPSKPGCCSLVPIETCKIVARDSQSREWVK